MTAFRSDPTRPIGPRPAPLLTAVAGIACLCLALAACGGGSSDSGPLIDETGPVIPTMNVREDSVLRSGFVAGTASDGAGSGVALVEVSVDGGGFVVATGTTSWRIAIPTGASIWRDGSEHTVAVRATDAFDNVGTTVGPITFKKGGNHDINGDGYADVVTKAVDPATTTLHLVYIFLSDGAAGLPASVAAASADTIITGEAEPQSFGSSLATGDVNADGYADVLVGGYSGITQTGKVYVFLSGGAGGLPTTVAATAADTIFTGAAAGDGFAAQLAGADMNGDGYADVVCTASSASSNTGVAYVYLSGGSTPWAATVATTSADSVLTGEATGNFFGASLALGDVNNDTYADVLIGAPNHNAGLANQGRAYLFRSTSSGLGTPVAASAANTIWTGAVASSFFGRAVTFGDVNGDGNADVIISGTADANVTGSLYVYHADGTATAFAATLAPAAADTLLSGEGASNQFGLPIASADVNGDGVADLLTTDQPYTSSTGRSYLFLSTASGLGSTVAAGSANSILTGEGTSNYFGIALALADVNGDGLNDLLSGAYGYSNRGRVYLFLSDGTTPLPATVGAGTADSTLTGSLGPGTFGISLAP